MRAIILVLSFITISCSTVRYAPVNERVDIKCSRADNELYLINHKVLTYKYICEKNK